jgi:hypothetical protein
MTKRPAKSKGEPSAKDEANKALEAVSVKPESVAIAPENPKPKSKKAKISDSDATAPEKAPKAKSKDADSGSKPKRAEKEIEKATKSLKKPKESAAPVPREVPIASAPTGIFVSEDEIRHRAFALSEQRRLLGYPGTPDQDWAEAERQLRSR